MKDWPRPEMADCPGRKNQLPDSGAMTHADYTAHAHALLVRRLIGNFGYADIYTDQDELIRNAFLSAFRAKVADDHANLAYVQFQKHMIIDEKREHSNKSRGALARMLNQLKVKGLTEEIMIVRLMGLEYAILSAAIPEWRRKWVRHADLQ